jgi:hypothetical protein
MMELDELKSAWQFLDRKLSRESAINLALYRDQKLDQVRFSLQPLRREQVVQLLAGIGIVVFAGFLWSAKPTAISIILAGVAVQLYGIACIISAGVVLSGIRNVDYSGSVLQIQNRLARVRRAYFLAGIVAGLPWWFIWLPFLMVLAHFGGVNLYANAPSVIWSGLGVGAVGLLASWWLYSYSRDGSRPRLNRWVDDAMTGRSLRRAQAQLEEVRRFEQD